MIKKYILPALLLLSLLTGCGCSGPSPEEVIAKAIDAINELQTYRFEMTGMMTQDGETSHASMQGEFVSPDRLHMTTVSDDETAEGIRIGQTDYARQSDSDNWEVREWPATMAWAAIRNNLALVTVEIIDTLVELVELGDEKIDGVSCFHYRGSVDVEAMVEERIANLDPTLPGYEGIVRTIEQQLQSEQSAEFWIGKEDYLLRQIETYQDMTYTEDAGEDTEREARITATYSFRFFDFDEPIEIKSPIVE